MASVGETKITIMFIPLHWGYSLLVVLRGDVVDVLAIVEGEGE